MNPECSSRLQEEGDEKGKKNQLARQLLRGKKAGGFWFLPAWARERERERRGEA